MSDIYEEAVADARKLREKAAEAVEAQLVERFRPKIEEHIERVLMQEAGDDGSNDDEDENILLGGGFEGGEAVEDDAEGNEDVARDVEQSMVDGGGEEAALSINTDGTVTLELDKMVVPEDSSVEPVDDVDDDRDATSTASKGEQVSEPERLVSADVKEAVKRADALRTLASEVSGKDRPAVYRRLARVYEAAVAAAVPSDLAEVDRPTLAALTTLAEGIDGAYMDARRSAACGSILDEACSSFEATYSRINDVVTEAVCARVVRRIDALRRSVVRASRLNEAMKRRGAAKVYSEVDRLCRIIEAIADRTSPAKAARMHKKVSNLVMEMKQMTGRRRLDEDEVVLKLELPDGEAKEQVLDVLDGDEEGGGDDLDDILGGDEDEGDDLGLDLEADDRPPGDVEEVASAADDLARLFEADDEDDEGDDDILGLDLTDDEGDEVPEGDLGQEDDGGDAAADLERVADVLRGLDGDVDVEVVDDEGASDDSVELDLDDAGEEDPIDEDDDMGEGDAYVEIDMNEVTAALAEMDTKYHKLTCDGPGAGIDDFGGGSEDEEAFVDKDDSDLRRESRRRRRRTRLSEGRRRPKDPSAREVALMRRRLTEAKRKEHQNTLLSAKLLYTNKLLQRSDLTEGQRRRVVDAMDEAGNLREARLLYRNLVRAFEQRRRNRLTEGRTRPVGSSSKVSLNSGLSRPSKGTDSPNSSMLNEGIDLDLWRRHAGLE